MDHRKKRQCPKFLSIEKRIADPKFRGKRKGDGKYRQPACTRAPRSTQNPPKIRINKSPDCMYQRPPGIARRPRR